MPTTSTFTGAVAGTTGGTGSYGLDVTFATGGILRSVVVGAGNTNPRAYTTGGALCSLPYTYTAGQTLRLCADVSAGVGKYASPLASGAVPGFTIGGNYSGSVNAFPTAGGGGYTAHAIGVSVSPNVTVTLGRANELDLPRPNPELVVNGTFAGAVKTPWTELRADWTFPSGRARVTSNTTSSFFAFSDYMAVTAGQDYAASVYFHAKSLTGSGVLHVRWYDSGFSEIDLASDNIPTTLPATLPLSGTAPTGAVWARIAIGNGSSNSIGQYIEFDDVSLTEVNKQAIKVRRGAETLAREILADNPLVYWKLDDTSGSVANDYSPNNRHGTYANALEAYSQVPLLSRGSRSASFEPASLHRVRADDAPWMTGMNALTFEQVIRPEALPTDGGAWHVWWGKQESFWAGYYVWEGLHRYSIGVYVSLTDWIGYDFVVPAPPTDEAQHVVMTWDGTGGSPSWVGSFKCYVNGVSQDTVLPYGGGGFEGGNTIYDGTLPLTWGCWADAGDWFDGRASDVALYGTVLSPARVAAHYEAATINQALATPLVAELDDTLFTVELDMPGPFAVELDEPVFTETLDQPLSTVALDAAEATVTLDEAEYTVEIEDLVPLP